MCAVIHRLPDDGLSPSQAEQAIAERAIERIYFFDASARQFAAFEGEEGYVFFRLTSNERRRVAGGSIVHNHPPRADLAPNDPRYDSASFSPFDWRTAVDLDVAEMIAVSPSWRFVLRRPANGWLSLYHSVDDLLEMLDLMIRHWSRDDDRVIRGATTDDAITEANEMHEINIEFADEIKARYWRERR